MGPPESRFEILVMPGYGFVGAGFFGFGGFLSAIALRTLHGYTA